LISLVAEHTCLVAFSEEDSPHPASRKAQATVVTTATRAQCVRIFVGRLV
jgi:hypothetical protein